MRVPLRARSVSSLLLLALLLGGCSAGGWFVDLFKQRPTPLPPASELYAAGDCVAPRGVHHAILDGTRVARAL